MATPGKKTAESLEVLKKLQDKGKVAIKTADLSRVHRERLVKNNFLKEVAKGWYMVIPPDEAEGDSTSWYASYWAFCAEYLHDRFGDAWCLSPEQSLLLHTGNRTIPLQLIVRSTDGPNGVTPLPYNTSLFTMKSPLPETAEITTSDGLRMLTLPAALVHCTALMFEKNKTDTRAALSVIRDASEVLGILLTGGHSTIAGRLAGAFRNIGRADIADEILKTMQSAGYNVRETDPYENLSPVSYNRREVSPYINRIRLMWDEMREPVIKVFPKSPGIPVNKSAYMKRVEELYITDAYHSLSIEKYRVTPELIEHVRSGEWDVNTNPDDKRQRDAMAARGYWQATQKVRESLLKILNGGNPGDVAEADHSEWYRELFAPGVAANIIKPSDLAGYRNSQVYISQSKHVPLNANAVRDAMPAFFDLLKQETEPSVRAVLGHFIFVYIHPYMDGNGRMARFLMNAMLASGGYPWTVITIDNRNRYMKALEKASVESFIDDFARYLGQIVTKSMDAGTVGAD